MDSLYSGFPWNFSIQTILINNVNINFNINTKKITCQLYLALYNYEISGSY